MPASHSKKDGARAPANPQRIAIVSPGHPSVARGEAEIAAFTLYEGLLKQGHDAIHIAVVAERDRKKASRTSDREYLIQVPDDSFDAFYQLSSQNVGAEIEAIIRKHGSQFVNFHHFRSLGLDSIRRVRTIPNLRMTFTFHDYRALCHNHGLMVTPDGRGLCETSSPETCVGCFPDRTRFDFLQRRRLVLDVLSTFEQFVAPSHFLGERLCDWGLDRNRMFVVENGVAGSSQTRSRARAKHAGADWVFGYFGPISTLEGVDVLIEAARIVRTTHRANARVRVHGHDAAKGAAIGERLRAAVEDGVVEFAGSYEGRAVGRLMADCDYVVAPSRWWQNSPLVIQQAFAAGRPVLCSGIGGMAEKVRSGESGLHFAPGSAADLARCIGEAANEDIYNRLASGLPRPPDAADMARRYLEVFLAPAKPKASAKITETSDAIQAITFG